MRAQLVDLMNADMITNRLPAPWRPYAKAILPSLVALASVGLQWALTGDLDKAALNTALTAFAMVLITFVAPNKQKVRRDV